MCGRLVCLLVDYQQYAKYCYMEDGAYIPFMVLWMERNDRCFKDHKRTLKKIKLFFFKNLYLWVAVYVSPLTLVILISLFFLLLVKCFLLYNFRILRGAFTLLMIFADYLFKKKESCIKLKMQGP
jgi:hypothetical protein